MLSNMVQPRKPDTPAIGALQAPPPIVTQLTLVEFEARNSNYQEEKKEIVMLVLLK